MHRARSILEPKSVLCMALSAVFRGICNILSRFACFRFSSDKVSFKVYFGLLFLYVYSVDLRLVWCLFGVDLKSKFVDLK